MFTHPLRRVLGMLLICGLLAMPSVFAQGDAESLKPEPVLSPGDLVYVDVYRKPELSVTTTIDYNGNITLPSPIGAVRVSGMTEKDATKIVQDAYLRILKNPRITVSRTAPSTQTSFRTADMTTELIPLQNANAENLSEALEGMTSAGGTISFDPDTYTLIITDTPDAIRNIKAVVERLDGMKSLVSQVRIEARIAEMKIGAMRELGLRWSVQEDQMGTGYNPLGVQTLELNQLRGDSAGVNANENIDAGGGGNTGYGGGRTYVESSPFDRRMVLPITVGKPGEIFFGLLNKNIDLSIMLDALVGDNKADILASPSILTVNHKLAEIKSADMYPYASHGFESGSSTFSTDFLDVGIVLRVTPHIRKDDLGQYVNMELEPEISFPAGFANDVPIRSVRSVKNNVHVRDAQTLVIGGIYSNEHKNVESGVPGLRKLPLVGNLFKRTEKVNSQTELVIFVTPHIHETPDTVTWDRMLDLPTAAQVLDKASPNETQAEYRRE